MGILSVLVAAAAGYAFGAVWYMMLAKPWMEASGVAVGDDRRPANASNPIPYIVAFGSAVLVAGMMRHVFSLSGIDTVDKGLVSGLGIGLFLAAPWLLTCYGFSGRPFRLVMIDGGYATIASGLIGAVITLF